MVELDLSESRYDRQERITWWDQRRLSDAHVLVIGAGALGNEVVKNLVLIGVGTVDIYDFDVVEMSNLARCVFFSATDEGHSKALVLAEAAGRLNADVTVRGHDLDVRQLGSGPFADADAIVGALDNREARLYVNRIAWRVNRPWVDGAIEGLSGIARVFRPSLSCYECTLSEADFQQIAHRRSCRLLTRDQMVAGKVPTTATTASIIGGLQAQEVVKLIHGDTASHQVGLNGGLRFEGDINDVYPIVYPLVEECFAHHTFEAPTRLAMAADRTWTDVVNAVGWTEATVELDDDWLIEWHCAPCNSTVPDAGPLALVAQGDATCPRCRDARTPITIASIAVPGPHADTTLSAMNTRSNEWYAVRLGIEYRYVAITDPEVADGR